MFVRSLPELYYLLNSLLRYPLQRAIIVEAKIASMKDIVRFGCFGEFIQGSQITCRASISAKIYSVSDTQVPRTSATQRTLVEPDWITRPLFGRSA